MWRSSVFMAGLDDRSGNRPVLWWWLVVVESKVLPERNRDCRGDTDHLLRQDAESQHRK